MIQTDVEHNSQVGLRSVTRRDCALTLPCQAPGSAPVGLTVTGPALSDQRILAIGLVIEDDWRARQ
ncbi:hypothetical protein [Propionivibrio sp.]|uniref:hypothetical protein n=1 Tax=Propionivibrio sp. TaxID=2212460 RepID=UPI00261EA7D8|nr:hypothetical protein [Propionivibrio sp.]